jgi:hypothetical protein
MLSFCWLKHIHFALPLYKIDCWSIFILAAGQEMLSYGSSPPSQEHTICLYLKPDGYRPPVPSHLSSFQALLPHFEYFSVLSIHILSHITYLVSVIILDKTLKSLSVEYIKLMKPK